jgi:hypothetical protein
VGANEKADRPQGGVIVDPRRGCSVRSICGAGCIGGMYMRYAHLTTTGTLWLTSENVLLGVRQAG